VNPETAERSIGAEQQLRNRRTGPSPPNAGFDRRIPASIAESHRFAYLV
jgi:hypothetical protein